jgi:hypothetical protein
MFEIKKFKSFEEFYKEILSYSCDFFHSQNKYIYRGTFGDYKLLPKALRDKEAEKRTYKEQQDYELEYLNKFIKYSNDNGLKVPNDVMDNDGKLEDLRGEIWLPDKYEELAALAQHYGLPTRLLDWSFDIFVSLYFASINAIKAKHKGDEKVCENDKEISNDLIIWACRLDAKNCKAEKGNLCNPLRFTIPSYYNNPNLNAQKGILTAWKRKSENLEQLIEIKSLENLFEENFTRVQDTIFYKFVLPIECCFDMFDYAEKHNYNAARLFPGYEGIKKYIYEKEMRDKLYAPKQFSMNLQNDVTIKIKPL